MKVLTVVLLFVGSGLATPIARAQELQELSPGMQKRLQTIKRELGFAEWKDHVRSARHIVVLDSRDVMAVLPEGVTCTARKVGKQWSAYRLECVRNPGEKNSVRIGIEAWAMTGERQAKELLVQNVLYMSAPLNYLKPKWKKEDAAWGDKSLGLAEWCAGNVVFRLKDGRDQEAFVRDVFKTIDKALANYPEKVSPLPNGLGLAIGTTTDGEKAEYWVLDVTEKPKDALLVFNLSDVRAKRSAEGKLLVPRKAGGAKTVDIVLTRRGKVAQRFSVALREGTVEDGQATR